MILSQFIRLYDIPRIDDYFSPIVLFFFHIILQYIT